MSSLLRPKPRFFLDRGLGAVAVPSALRDAGWQVATMDEVYGADQSQLVQDIEWIRDQTAAGYCLLTKDTRIAHDPAEAEAIWMSDARVVTLTSAKITAATMVERLLKHSETIHSWARSVPPPFVLGVSATRIRRVRLRYPPGR